jgi:hypothetical protein
MSVLEVFLALLWVVCIAALIHSHVWHKQYKAEKAQISLQDDEDEV